MNESPTSEPGTAWSALGSEGPGESTTSVRSTPASEPGGHIGHTGRRRRTVIGGVLAALLAGGGVTAVELAGSHSAAGASSTGGVGGFGPAAGGRPGGGQGVRGTIAEISGSSLEVKSSSGSTWTVKTTADTVVSEQVASSLSSLKTGDILVITRATDSFAATSVVDTGQRVEAGGQAGASGGPGGTPGGAPGNASPTGGSISGPPVGGAGSESGPPSGSQGGPPGQTGSGGSQPTGAGGSAAGMPGYGTFGTLTRVSGSTLILSTNGGDTLTVTTTGSTAFYRVQTGKVSDLATGDRVMVRGSTSGTEITAERIDEIRSQ